MDKELPRIGTVAADFIHFVKERAVEPETGAPSGLSHYEVQDESFGQLVPVRRISFSHYAGDDETAGFTSIIMEVEDDKRGNGSYLPVFEMMLIDGVFSRALGPFSRDVGDDEPIDTMRRIKAAEAAGRLTLFKQ